jgi:ribonuclease-3|tara:strand:+ start:169 stop:864 length:696 start_codon:yes stop_codon:yes gene_type:complete
MENKELKILEKSIKYKFKDKSLLMLAMTHRSYSGKNNERLEFLGDSILNFVVADLLFKKFNDLDEGDLSRLRSQMVKEEPLSKLGNELKIGDFLNLGVGELKSSGWRRPSILADAFEALIGAIFIDSGMDSAYKFIEDSYADLIEKINPKEIHKDPKTILQEFLQAQKVSLPSYEVIKVEGDAHNQLFTVTCEVSKFDIKAEGGGRSRKIAEQEAAKEAMATIEKSLYGIV